MSSVRVFLLRLHTESASSLKFRIEYFLILQLSIFSVQQQHYSLQYIFVCVQQISRWDLRIWITGLRGCTASTEKPIKRLSERIPERPAILTERLASSEGNPYFPEYTRQKPAKSIMFAALCIFPLLSSQANKSGSLNFSVFVTCRTKSAPHPSS